MKEIDGYFHNDNLQTFIFLQPEIVEKCQQNAWNFPIANTFAFGLVDVQ